MHEPIIHACITHHEAASASIPTSIPGEDVIRYHNPDSLSELTRTISMSWVPSDVGTWREAGKRPELVHLHLH